MADDPSRGGPPRSERAYKRVSIDAFVRILGADREYAFRTRNLSEGGLFLDTRVGHLYPLSVGSDVAIELHHAPPTGADTVLALRGVVVRIVEVGSPEAARYPTGFGVRLNPLSPQERSILLDVLRAAAEPGGPPDPPQG